MTEYCELCKNLYEIRPDGNKPVQLCLNCQHKKDLPENTLLYTKHNFKGYLEHDPITIGIAEQKINSPVIMKTKNYNCPNPKCETHKHPELKEASFERFNHLSYRVYYICDVCGTRWY